MAVYLSKHQGLAGSERITIDNYSDLILKVGIGKLPEPLLKGHQYFSANISKYNSNESIAETINDYLADLNAYVDKLPSKRQKEIFEENKGYSGNKWEGKHYKNTEDLSTAEISKLIKKELEIEFEDVAKFSVISDVFSGGSSINVSITDLSFIPYNQNFLQHLEAGKSIHEYDEAHKNHYNEYTSRFNDEFNKLVKKVESITNQYNFDDSDIQTDYFHVRYYKHVKFDEERYLLKHYPDNPEAKRRKEWDEQWEKSKAKSKEKADSQKGKYKKGAIMFFKAEMHKSWHRYLLPNGLYLVEILKAPNGRARFSHSYSIRIYQNISVMQPAYLELLTKRGADKYFLKNEYGTFYGGDQVLSADEKQLIALNEPAAKQEPEVKKTKFNYGELVFYKGKLHEWGEFKFENKMFLAQIFRLPSSKDLVEKNYSVYILQNIDVLKKGKKEYKREHGQSYVTNEFGTFRLSPAITIPERDMLALDDPGAKIHSAKEPKQQAKKISEPKKENSLIVAPAIEAEEIPAAHYSNRYNVKAYEQVTKQNYSNFQFDINGWPEYLKLGHEFMIGETDGFKNLELAKDDPEILAAIELYLVQLNAYLSNLKDSKSKIKITGNPVREISPSVKLINRFANLNGKTLTEKQLSSFIKTMQKAMATQKIRANDPHQATIYHIQDVLVDTFNEAEPDDRIQFTIKGGDKYKAIGKSETEMLSVKLIKRYIALIGKTDKTKQRRLHGDINKAIENGKILANDPLISTLQKAIISLQAAFTGKGKLIIPDAELSGLHGLGFIPAMIAAAVGKGIEHFAHKALKPANELKGLGCACQDHNKGIEGTTFENGKDQDIDRVQSVGEAKKLKFELIGLDGKYLKLIGKACRPTSFFIYGPGGSGKSTFTLLFGNYMAQKGNRVLYVAGEQKDTPVFTEMLERLKIQDTEKFGIVKRVGGHDLNKYDILVIDSKDSIDYTLEDFKQQREHYPHLSFVILSQATKNGGFTGTEKWRNEVDTLILCENLIAYTNRDKNRWGGSDEIKILELIK